MANEKRLIDANEVICSMQMVIDEENNPNSLGCRVMREIIKGLELTPTVDAVEVVRCKDCKFPIKDDMYGGYWCNGSRVPSNWYCADGERRTE